MKPAHEKSLAPASPGFHSPELFDLDRLYREHRSWMLGLAHRYLKRREEAEEAVQESFLRAQKALSGFQGLCQPKTWLYRILVNECLTRIAQWKKENERVSQFTLEPQPDEETFCEGGDCLAQEMVTKMLDASSSETRKILLLALGDGLSHRQIAESLGVSRVAITKRISKFKRRIQILRRLANGEISPASRIRRQERCAQPRLAA
jgi:RNA polymerase sigma-70 factor (ECF subfamily)